MPLDQSRIQGFGSDGSKQMTWRCPKNHLLQPWKANPGRCDGCNARVEHGDSVMDCRQCNWYLCDECHPQQKEKSDDWFWGSMSYLVEQATQEVTEVAAEFKEMAGEFETFMSDMAFTSCGVVDGKQFVADELSFDSKGDNKKSRKPETQKRSRSSKRIGPETRQKEKKAEEEAAAASGAEADEEGEDSVMKAPSTPQAVSAASSKGTQSKCFTDKAKAAAKVEAEVSAPAAPAAPVMPEAKAPPPPMEDLLDIGQNDLLDLDLEPMAVAKKEEEDVAASAPAKEGLQAPVSATAAHEDLLDLDLNFSEGTKPANTTAEVDLLPDLDLFK